jgi:transcription antitermination factor NusG
LFFALRNVACMWHVLHVSPNSEPQVAKLLSLIGVESYAPQFPAPPRTKPGSVRDRRTRWVFPGYIFFKIAKSFTEWDSIRWAPGVRRILQQDDGPGVVDDEIVEHLHDRLRDRTLAPSRRFRPGQVVAIERGPLAMVDAIFQRQLPASERVEILVHLLGRPLTVTVDPAILRPTG